MKPTDTLKEEHRVIERGLTALSMAVERLETGEEVPGEILDKAVDFIRGFADRCHHQKEEDILFPYLERKGLTETKDLSESCWPSMMWGGSTFAA